MFCVECGLCVLDVTGSGTVIAPPPQDPALVSRRTLQSVDRLLEELEGAEAPAATSPPPPPPRAPAPDDFHIELVDDDIEVLDEEEQPTRQYTKSMLRQLLAGRSPVKRRITAAYGVIE